MTPRFPYKIYKDKTVIGKGVEIGDRMEKPVDVIIRDDDRKGHLFTFGSTRIGKTRLIDAMVTQDIKKGRSVIIIDPKSDQDLLSSVWQTAEEVGRIDDFFLITPIFPEYSTKVNPLSHFFRPEELATHVTSGIITEEKFYVDVATEVAQTVIQALLLFARAERKPAILTFEIIQDHISYEDLIRLRDNLEALDHPEKGRILRILNQILQSTQDYYSKINSSLRTIMTSLSTGAAGMVLGQSKENPFLDRLVAGKTVIVVVQTGSLIMKKTAHSIGRVILSMIQAFVGRKFYHGEKFFPELCIYVDEFSQVAYYGIETLLSQAGGCNCWLSLFTQSIADLEDEGMNPAFARKILDNTNSKIFMRVNDPKTSQYISEYAGTSFGFSPIYSLSGDINMREVEEPKIKPEEIQNQQKRQFIYFGFNGAFKGKVVPMVDPDYLLKFPMIDTSFAGVEIPGLERGNDTIIKAA
jgi:type IV secretory pathway TraG/TraD family ATPase VirD4